jgi:hypothetical protein
MILPTPGSVTAELFTLSEADFRNRFGKPLPRSPEPVPPESLSGFADRVFGNLLWLLPDGILVGARFPPFATRPEALTFAYGWIAGRGGLLDRAAAVGLPQPDVDPAYVLGESGMDGVPLGRSLKYIPAPLNLAELTYTAFKQSNERVRVSIVAVMPDEPRRIELAQEWQKALPWLGTGTMYFKDVAEIQSLRGELFPPRRTRDATIAVNRPGELPRSSSADFQAIPWLPPAITRIW